jgi:hypothetical protein
MGYQCLPLPQTPTQTLAAGCLADAAGVRDGLDQHSGGALSLAPGRRCEWTLLLAWDGTARASPAIFPFDMSYVVDVPVVDSQSARQPDSVGTTMRLS